METAIQQYKQGERQMIREGKFGIQEAICLMVITMTSKMFFSSPAILASLVGNAGWMMTLVSVSVALIGFIFIYKLLKRFPGKGLVEIFNISLGSAAGFIFSGILGIYLMFLSVVRINELSEFLKVYVLPLSPNVFNVGLAVSCVLALSFSGLESIVRIAKLLIYIFMFSFLIIIVMSIQNYDINNIFPFFGTGIEKIMFYGVIRSSSYGEIIILAIFAFSLQGTKYIKKEGVISLILSGFALALSAFTYSLTFPYFTAQEITAPMFEMATIIDYSRFVQRVESIFLYVWISSTLLSAATVFYSFIRIYCESFKINDNKPVIIGGSIILYAAALMHTDIISVTKGTVQFIRNVGSIPTFLLPIITLIVALFRKKGEKANA